MPFRLLAVLLLTLALPVATSATPSKGAGQGPASVLEIPFRLPLDELLREAEQLVPTQTGHWHGWKKWHGVDTQYRAWRGRLSMQSRGDTLTMWAHAHGMLSLYHHGRFRMDEETFRRQFESSGARMMSGVATREFAAQLASYMTEAEPVGADA